MKMTNHLLPVHALTSLIDLDLAGIFSSWFNKMDIIPQSPHLHTSTNQRASGIGLLKWLRSEYIRGQINDDIDQQIVYVFFALF